MKLGLSIIAILLAAITLSAQPSTITYQGKLLDASGNPVTNPALSMTFAIYDSPGGANKIWPASGAAQKSVDVESGMYTVILGGGVDTNDDPFTSAHFAGNDAYLEVVVDGTTLPRTQLMSVPYSFRSALSESLSGSGWASPGDIGSTTPNAGAFTSITASNASFTNLTITNGAAAGKVLTSNAGGKGSWQFPGPGVSYHHVINVAKSSGDYTAINDALAAVGEHNESNRWLIKVHPGTYNEKIEMLEYVDIEGSGQDITVIMSNGSSSATFENFMNTGDPTGVATVLTVNNAEIRNLTVISSGGDASVAMLNMSSLFGGLFEDLFGTQFGDLFAAQFGDVPDGFGIFEGLELASVHHATIIASGGSINIGFFNFGEFPMALLNHVKICAFPTVFLEEIGVGIGIWQMGMAASMVVRNSFILGLPFSVGHCGGGFGGAETYICGETCFCGLLGTSTRFVGLFEFCNDEFSDFIRLTGCSYTGFDDDIYEPYLDVPLDTYGNPGNPGDVLTIIPDPYNILEFGIAVWDSPFIKGSVYSNLPSIANSTQYTQTFSVAGAEIGGTVSVSPASSLNGLIIAAAWVSSSGTVSVTFANYSGSAIDNGNMIFYFAIIPPESSP